MTFFLTTRVRPNFAWRAHEQGQGGERWETVAPNSTCGRVDLMHQFIFCTEVFNIQNITHHARCIFRETAMGRQTTPSSIIWMTLSFSSLFTNVSKLWRIQYIHHQAVNSVRGFSLHCPMLHSVPNPLPCWPHPNPSQISRKGSSRYTT